MTTTESQLAKDAIYTNADFTDFVDSFSDDLNGLNAIPNYARFCNMDRSSILRNYNSDNNPPGVHKTINRLVNEREQAKAESRGLRNEITKLKRQLIKANEAK